MNQDPVGQTNSPAPLTGSSSLQPVASVLSKASVNSPSAPTPQPPRKNLFKGLVWISVGVLVLGILSIAGVIYASFRPSSKVASSSSDIASKYDAATIPLDALAKSGNLGIDSAGSLSINGQLRVNNAFVLAPTAAPTAGSKGQIYFDQTTNSLQVYDGEKFQPIITAGTQAAPTTIDGHSGDITLGAGFTFNGNQLVNSSTSSQTSGVSSIQGQNGAVTLTSGGGISIVGTTISNTGVTSLGGTTGAVAIGSGLNLAGGTLSATGSTVTIGSSDGSILVTNNGNGNFDIVAVQGPPGSNALLLAPAGPQPDSSNLPTLSFNKTGSGNLIQLSTGSTPVDRFVVDQSGAIITGTIGFNQITNAPNFVNTVGGSQGDLLLGSGLSISGQTISNSGVVSIGGGSGVLTLGTGLGRVGQQVSNTGVTSLSGTLHQVTVSGATGGINLSLPQDIDSAASPSFTNLSLSGNATVGGNATVTGSISGASVSTTGNIASSGGNVSGTNVSASGNLSAGGSVTGASVSATGAVSGATINGLQETSNAVGFTILGGTTSKTLTVTSDANINQDLSTVSTPTFNNLIVTTDTSLGRDVTITRNTTIGGTLGITGNTTVGGTLTTDTITTNNGLTIGNTTKSLTIQGASPSITSTSGPNVSTLAFDAPTASVTYRLRAASAGTFDICTSTGNCAGAGGGVTTPGGTIGAIAKFSGSQTIADSILSESGSTITVAGTLTVNTITPTGTFTVGTSGHDLALAGAATTISATSGAKTTTVNFATPTNNQTISFPDAGGTICTTVATTCAGSYQAAGNYVTLQATTPGSAQSGNINVNGTIIGGTLSSGGGLSVASTATVGSLTVNNNAGVSGNLSVTGTATASSFNALTLTANAVGFTISGGTSSRSLIVGDNGTINQNVTTTSTPTFAGLTLSTTPLGISSGGTGLNTTPTNGQILIGNGTNYTLNTITAGTGVVITNGAGSIMVDVPSAGSCGVCANNDLSNLAAVKINTTLLPALATSVDLGSLTRPFREAYLYGTSGSMSNNFKLTGAATASRTVTFDDLSGTIALLQSAGASSPQTGEINLTGPLITGSVQSPQLVTAPTSTASTNSVGITLKTGNATGSTSNSGSLTIDSGTATGTAGSITIGGANASALTLGRSALAASIPGGLTTSNANINAGTGTITSGAINGQTISAAASFTGTVTVQGASGVTVGLASTNTGTINFKNSSNANVLTLQSGATTANITFTLPTADGTGGQCISTNGAGQLSFTNCSSGLSGSGTAGKLAKFTGSATVADSLVSESGSVVTISGTLGVNNIVPTAAFTVGATGQNLTLVGLAGSTANTTLSGYNGAGTFATQLYFATPTANRAIKVPDRGGTVAVSASGIIQLDANGDISCPTCGTSSGGIAQLNGLTASSISIQDADGNQLPTSGVSIITVPNATSSTKGLATFNSTNFSVAAGAVNTIQNIATTSAPTFAGATLNGASSVALTGTQNFAVTSDLAGNVNVVSISATPSSTAGTTRGIFLQQASSANTNGLDNAIVINNANTSLAITNGISFTNTGGGGFTKFLDTPSINISGTGAISGATGLSTSGTVTFSALSAGILHAAAGGGISSSAIDLASADVTGILPVANGGSGTSSVPTNGQVLIGNGTNYTAANLTPGTGVTITNGAGAITISVPSVGTCGTCASRDLSNLASVAINTSLLPATTTVDLGSNTSPFRDAYLYGSSVTGGAYTKLTAAPTGSRTITFPNASGTVCIDTNNCNYVNNQLTTPGTAQSGNLNLTGTIIAGTNISSGGGLTVANGTTTGTLSVTGAATVGSTLAVTGAVTGSSFNALSLTANANGFTIGGGSTTTHNFVVSGDSDINQSVTTTSSPSFAGLSLTTTPLGIASGGTGISATPANGELLIGNGTNYTKSTLTAGTGVTITNGGGSITVSVPAVGTCSTCANQTLNNLSSVAINTSLLSGSATIDLGSNTAPFRDLYLGGTTTNNFRFTGSASAARTLTLDDLTGKVALVQTVGASATQTGDFNISGTVIAGTALQTSSVLSAATSSPSTNSGSITIKTGNATGTTSNSGSVTFDVGTATGTAGSISIGTTNASAVTVGRTGITVSVPGSLTTNSVSPISGTFTLGLLTNTTNLQGAAVTIKSKDNTHTSTLAFPSTPTTDNTYTLPTDTHTTQTICTAEAGNCGGSGGGLTYSGTPTANVLPKFSGTGTATVASTISDDGTTITLGGIVKTNTIQANGGAMTIGSTTQNLTMQGAAVSLTGTTVAIKPTSGNDSSTAVTIQNAAGTFTILAVDTTSKQKVIIGNGTPTLTAATNGALYVTDSTELAGQVLIGTATNGIAIDASNHRVTYNGTSRNTKRITIPAEYAGSVLSTCTDSVGPACITNDVNLGTMTSGVDKVNRMNYFKWTTSQTNAQSYDIVAQIPLPSDFSAWANSGTNAFGLSVCSSTTTALTIQSIVTDSGGTVTTTDLTPGSTGCSTWTTKNLTFSSGTWTAGNYFTLRLRLTSPTSGDIRVGNITLDYLSSF